jgi:hypothetical protein
MSSTIHQNPIPRIASILIVSIHASVMTGTRTRTVKRRPNNMPVRKPKTTSIIIEEPADRTGSSTFVAEMPKWVQAGATERQGESGLGELLLLADVIGFEP